MGGEQMEMGMNKMVQELAETYQGPPNQFILKEEDRPINCEPLPVASDIPIIDFNRLFRSSSDDDGDEAEKLMFAVQSWGIFQAINHGLSSSFLDEVWNVAKEFFQLPTDVKMKYWRKMDPEGYGNYNVTRKDQIMDWNDRLRLLVQPEDKRRLDLWPKNPNSFGEVLNEYTMKTRKFAELLLSALAKLLKLDENYFINELGDTGEVFARFNYYPKCARPELVLGFAPHSDASMITIILPDKEVEGLQVLKDGDWFRVPIVPHALLINMGNQIQIMSNGIFKSSVHRVVASSKDRLSLAMFYGLDQEKILEPAHGLVDEMRPCLYRKMKTKDFFRAFFENYAQRATTIEWARV